ncbi:MAG: nicotinamide-nucleotide amidase [Gammaproteobacteria bacterium]
MNIAIICTGDEVLTGKTINTNYSFIAQHLQEHGYNTSVGLTVGDDRIALLSAFQQAAMLADAVIVNGGLGPTVDDLSQQVAAEAAEVELELCEEWLEKIHAYYAGSGREMPVNNRKQALLPAGAEVIDNPVGTACGFIIDIQKIPFYFTPGVPRELKRMLPEQILPRLRKLSGKQLVTGLKRFHTFGIGESRADLLLQDINEINQSEHIKLGFQSHYPELETKLFASAESTEQLQEILKPAATQVRSRLQDYIVAEDDESLESILLDQLQAIDGNLCVVDCATGGGVLDRLASHGQSWANSLTGFVASNPKNATKLLGLSFSSNNENWALETTRKARSISNSTHCLLIHSESIPGRNETSTVEKFTIVVDSDSGTASRITCLPGSAGWVRIGIIELALDCLRRYLLGEPIYQRIDFEQH